MTDTITDAARLSVAPMMDWTDSNCRRFHRLMSRRALLYTEMVTAPALVHGEAGRLLDYDAAEHPLALQLGGSDPAELGQAVRIAAPWGYDEINLNCGCPSDRVQSGAFGAILMTTPQVVADCVRAMQDACAVPVTVKCRIGVDDQTPDQVLPDFLDMLQRAGVTRVIIHARKAWLKGLSPKENRSVPPLDYPLVHRMKAEFPRMHLSINGGLSNLDQVRAHLDVMDGAMIGRAAYHDPWSILGGADALWDQTPPHAHPAGIAQAMRPVIEAHLAQGGRLHQMTRHMLGLFHGRPGARHWRRTLSEGASQGTIALYDQALSQVMQAA